MAEAMYASAAAGAGGEGGGAAGGPEYVHPEEDGQAKGDTVDADFTVVDDDDKK
jgi:hypothetical protein